MLADLCWLLEVPSKRSPLCSDRGESLAAAAAACCFQCLGGHCNCSAKAQQWHRAKVPWHSIEIASSVEVANLWSRYITVVYISTTSQPIARLMHFMHACYIAMFMGLYTGLFWLVGDGMRMHAGHGMVCKTWCLVFLLQQSHISMHPSLEYDYNSSGNESNSTSVSVSVLVRTVRTESEDWNCRANPDLH